MNKNFSSYKFISRLKCLRIIFLSFLFIFLANYMFNVCSSFLDISSTSYEISKRFEGEQSEEKENERETSYTIPLSGGCGSVNATCLQP